MLVLHGFWSTSNGVCLWFEDSDLTVKSPSQALRSARPHPFAAPADVITGIHAGKPGTAVLLLPSLRSAPLDSPELIRITPRPTPRTGPALLPWTVPVVSIDAASALTALNEPVADVRYGASIAYLADLAAFARELVERGRVLPALARDGHGAVAFWRPVVQGPDIVAMNSLIAAMPPVCRAEQGEHDAHELAMSALHAMLDSTMRAALPPGIDLLPPRHGRRPKRLPAEEAWLTALTAPDGRLEADPDELDTLVTSLRPWEDIGVSKAGPARATFRLTEIETETGETPADAGWRLEFLLQSMADPSLLVPAEQTWNDDGSLRRWLERPEELLLAELGRASRIYPELASGLRTARPSNLCLDTEGAYHFLSTAAPLLDEAGFGILLPSWWDRRRKLGLALSAYTPVDGVVAKASKFGTRPAGRVPLGACGRRRHPHRGRDRRARRDQGAADPAARPVGGRGPGAAAPRVGVPGAQTHRARDRGRDPHPGRQSPRRHRHPAGGHLGASRRLAGRAAQRGCGPVAATTRTPARVHRDAAPLPATRAVVAGVPVLTRVG